MAGVEQGGSPAEDSQHLNGELLLDPDEREGAVGPGTDEGAKKKRKKKKKGKGAGAGTGRARGRGRAGGGEAAARRPAEGSRGSNRARGAAAELTLLVAGGRWGAAGRLQAAGARLAWG